MMRRLYLGLMAAAVSVVLGAVGLEAVSVGLYYVKRGKLFYSDGPKSPQTQTGAHTAAEAVFHPYYSFIHRVGRKGPYRGALWTTNNVGFQVIAKLVQADPACCDYPTRKKDDEVVVGIFGGSVASGFALTAQYSPEFAERLAHIPAWAGKRIRILNFAMPGFKQPQQLITLAYYLSLGQHFDLVLNLDGFNEIVTSHRNWASGVEPSFPADILWGEWGRQLERSSLASQEDGGESYLAAYDRASERHWRKRAEDCSLASCYVVLIALADFRARQARDIDARGRKSEEQRTLFPTAISSRPGQQLDVLESAADQWAAGSRQMGALVRSAGGIYLHIVQPNQWLKTSGDYQPMERDHIYTWVIEPVNTGYPKLLSRIPQLIAAGVAVFDATAVFRGLPSREIYADDCCHYTEKGDAVLSAKIADQIATIVAAKSGMRRN